ncbi:UDP-N-acetylmuramoyl-L-alanyl-D-glutamate--2,6-diaminopimelate ligase [Coralloluteibacterium thermophilus]|uniref:UDP-N-acetylmuramoyl-L-alanyl-D-glutamate--2,6-diaminopimelate ligase n=1 Tax=Coralloluteibacterium thermophilum TaxID=2707049 RepID=A0ABV9NQA3_9GAMM
MTLDALLDGYLPAGEPRPPRIAVGGLTLDSRSVRPGDVFVALPGERTHGLAFADTAAAAGAAAIVYQPPAPVAPPAAVPSVAVAELARHLGPIASRFHRAPSQALDVIGVTGTNGKTSSVQLLAQALDGEGGRAGSIGTLGAGLHGALVESERTTPDVIAVHRLLARMRDAGARSVAMEVSSHALAQNRVDAVRFRVAAFTNLSRDHLDYHGDMARYGDAKARLFRWPGLECAVVNLDDPFGRRLYAALPASLRRIGVSSRGEDAATVHADGARLGAGGIAFDLCVGQARAPVRSPLVGRFNVDNLALVAGVLLALDWPLPRIAERLGRLRPVRGRMQRLDAAAGRPLVVVDYAHTPDALEQALRSMRAHTRGRLLCVFGCGGERDRGKRPQMGAIAGRLADLVYVTDDNPRGEDGDLIVAEILAGVAGTAHVRVERDRARAIAAAIAEGGEGDAVLIAGKGHEPYQEIGGVRHRFDDAAVARGLLEVPA